MSGFFDKYKEQYSYSNEEKSALAYCNHATENLDEEFVFDWSYERIMYDDLVEYEGDDTAAWVRRDAGKLDVILFRSAITKVCGAYCLDNGWTPPDSRNLAAKMNY